MENHDNLILVVEDDQGLNELISDKIEACGFLTHSFYDAKSAISWLMSNSSSLMVVDFSLPDLNALEFISAMKAEDITVPPFVVATGRGDERIAVEMMKLGARDYIVKDFSFLEKIEIIIPKIISTLENEQKLLEAEAEIKNQQKEFEELFEQAPVGYHEIDSTGKIVRINKTELELLGYTKEEMLRMYIWEISEYQENIHQIVLDKIAGKNISSASFEERLRKKDGTIFHAMLQDICLFDKTGKITGIRTTIQDIEELKKAENAIIENSNNLKKLIFESTKFIQSDSGKPDYNRILDTIVEISGARYGAFNLVELNGIEWKTVSLSGMNNIFDRATHYLGFDLKKKIWKPDPVRAEKIKGRIITVFQNLTELTGEVIPKVVSKTIEKSLNLGDVAVVNISKQNKAVGDFSLFFKEGNTIKNSEVVELYATQVALFIERMQAEADLKESEMKFRVLFAENPQPMWIYELETLRFLEVNNAAIHHYGYSRDEFLSLKLTDIIDDQEIPEFLRLIEETRKDQKTHGISKHKKKNGEKIQVEVSSVSAPTFGKSARHILVNDITEKKLAEDKLVESNSLLNATLESTADGILVVDRDGKAIIYNQKFAEMWKIPTEILVQNEDEQLLRYVSTQLKDYKEFISKVSFWYKHSDQTSFDIIGLVDGRTFERYSMAQKVDNEIVGRVWSFRDITERLKSEELLKMSDNRYKTFINSTTDLIFIKNNQLKHIVVNKPLCDFYNKTEEEIIGKGDEEIIDNKQLAENCLNSDKRTLSSNNIVIEEETVGNKCFEIVKFPVEYQRGCIGVGGFIRDITNRRKTENDLKVKMEEMTRFHKLTIDRELKMIALKTEINELLKKSGLKEKYTIV